MIPDLRDTILNSWRTNNRVTVFLIEHLPLGLWTTAVPGAPRRTIRMIAGHLHNARCMWIKTLGQELGVPVPRSLDRRRVGRKELVSALGRSSQGILRLLTLGCEHGGRIPMASTYIMAQSSAGRRACSDLFRGSRSAPPRPDRAGGPGVGLSIPVGGYVWPLAVDEACGGDEAPAALTPNPRMQPRGRRGADLRAAAPSLSALRNERFVRTRLIALSWCASRQAVPRDRLTSQGKWNTKDSSQQTTCCAVMPCTSSRPGTGRG